MNWLTNLVRPRIRALVNDRDVPENLWQKCPNCEQMLFHRELEANLRVCQHCGHHMRIGAKLRLDTLFDDGTYTLIETPKVAIDPLKFRDRKRYTDRLKDAQAAAGYNDVVRAAHGPMGGRPHVVAAMEFAFMGGSMGMAVGEALIAAAERAVKLKAPFVAVSSSGGARMQEGVLSLMQLPRSVIAVESVRDAGLPYIVVLTDPTTGGVSASFAMLGDVTLAEPGAIIGFAGTRVIEETIREKLPDGFQRAEYLRDHGMVDIVVERRHLKETLVRITSLLMDRRRDDSPAVESEPAPEPVPAEEQEAGAPS